jgi:pyruvate dehydrogenase phosphatase
MHPNEGDNINRLFKSSSGAYSHPVTRSFGDAALKWSSSIQQSLASEYLGEPPHPLLSSPPYLTSDPEIYNIQVQPGDFLVLGSDGLWDSLTNEEVVGLVGWFVNQLEAKRWSPPRPRSVHSGWNKYSFDLQGEYNEVRRSDQLPVQSKQVTTTSTGGIDGDRDGEDGTVYYKRWNTEKRFVNVDANAATHLTRNALGGADRDIRNAVLDLVGGSKEAARFK